MRRRIGGALLALIWITPVSVASEPEPPPRTSAPAAAVEGTSSPVVVAIDILPAHGIAREAGRAGDAAGARSSTHGTRNPRMRTALGFVTEATGIVVTAYSPLVDPVSGRLVESIRIRDRGAPAASAVPAHVIGVEPTLGFALLQIEGAAGRAVSRLASDGAPEPGTPLFAPTRADGEDPGLVRGVLSALNTRECYQESLTSTLYRARLDLTSDSIGAPVYTQDGRIVALHTGVAPEPGADHVEEPGSIHLLPIFLIENIYESLKQKKSLRSPWTGFSVRRLTEAERAWVGLDRRFRGGIAIEAVWPGSPAEALGIRVGDVLLQFAHNPIASVADFQKWLYLYGVGAEVKLVFLRGSGEEREYLVAEMPLEERPAWAKPR